MKKVFALFVMMFALVLLVGCAEEPVEEELVTEEAEETLEAAPEGEPLSAETGPDAMEDTAMSDTAMETEGDMMEESDMESEGDTMMDEEDQN